MTLISGILTKAFYSMAVRSEPPAASPPEIEMQGTHTPPVQPAVQPWGNPVPVPLQRTQNLFPGALNLPEAALLQSEKEKYEKILRTLNGKYYQDPQSSLKQAWDTLLEKVPLTGQHVTLRPDLDSCMRALEDTQTTVSMNAKSSIHNYLLLELKRDISEAFFKTIVSIQKNEPVAADPLLEKKKVLENRQKQLCGNSYEDSLSLLDRAWKQYKQAYEECNPNADVLHSSYLVLEEERKTIEAELFFLEQQLLLSPTPHNTLTSLLEIQRQIEFLETQSGEKLRTGRMDWNQTQAQTLRYSLFHIAGHLLNR